MHVGGRYAPGQGQPPGSAFRALEIIRIRIDLDSFHDLAHSHDDSIAGSAQDRTLPDSGTTAHTPSRAAHSRAKRSPARRYRSPRAAGARTVRGAAMAGPAGALDDALQQALQAQLAPHAHLDGWRCRYAPAADASALPSPAPRNSLAIAHTVGQVESNDARPGAARPRAGTSGTAAADGSVQIAEAKQAARPKPVPPPRSGEQRKAALDAARQRNAELKALRAGLQARQLTLAELLALAESDHTAGRMLVRTALQALPGTRSPRASQVVAAAGIDPGRRAGALTAGQRERLVAAVAVVDAEPAARHGHRVTNPASVRDVPRSRCGGGAVPRAVLAHPAPGQIPSAQSSSGPRR